MEDKLYLWLNHIKLFTSKAKEIKLNYFFSSNTEKFEFVYDVLLIEEWQNILDEFKNTIESYSKLENSFAKLRFLELEYSTTIKEYLNWHDKNKVYIHSYLLSEKYSDIEPLIQFEDFEKMYNLQKYTLKFLKIFVSNLQLENNRQTTTQPPPPQKGIESIWQDLIKLELQDRLIEIEQKMEQKISNWKQRKSLIECAGFCQLLYDKKYFVQGSTNQKSVNSFALIRYGTDISIQLKTAKEKSRNTHKEILKKYFD